MSHSPGNRATSDIYLSLVLLAISLGIFLGTLGLPAPVYEPLGSAAMPRTGAIILAILALILMIQSLMRPHKTGRDAATDAAAPHRRRPGLAIFAYCLTVVFVWVMDFGLAGFVASSIAFVLAFGLLLTGGNRKQIAWIVALAIVLPTVSFVVFTRFFYIDLP